MMKPTLLLSAILALALAGAAQDTGYWRASSNTAAKITGDIAISSSRLTIGFAAFPLDFVRTLKPAEVSAVFDADVNAGFTGTLYRVKVPAERRFQHHNTLCGSEDTTWMATFLSGRALQVAFFSGPDAPLFTMDAIGRSEALCGTYTYVR